MFRPAAVSSWFSADCKLGSLCLHLEYPSCFVAEIYAADLGLDDVCPSSFNPKKWREKDCLSSPLKPVYNNLFLLYVHHIQEGIFFYIYAYLKLWSPSLAPLGVAFHGTVNLSTLLANVTTFS